MARGRDLEGRVSRVERRRSRPISLDQDGPEVIPMMIDPLTGVGRKLTPEELAMTDEEFKAHGEELGRQAGREVLFVPGERQPPWVRGRS